MRLLRPALAAAVGVVLFAAPAVAGLGQATKSLPNLVPRPPGLQLGDADSGTGERAIRLQTPMTNVGDAHLDLVGVADTSLERSTALQCVAWTHDRVCSERVEVGHFVWHPEHGHHHFQDFALYELRKIRAGRPDMSRRGLIAGGDKVSFCLMDTNRADTDAPDLTDSTIYGWPLYKSCLAGTGHQGISRGWADTYTFPRVEQQIVVDGIGSGIYAVVVTVDPKDLVFETSDSDNSVVTKVRLTRNRVEEICVFESDLRRCKARAATQ